MLKYQIRSIRLVFRYVPAQAALTLLVFVLSAIDLPLALYYIQRILMVLSEALQENTPVAAAWWEVALFVVLFVGAKLSLPTRNLCQVVIGNRLMHTLAERIMDKLSRLPYGAFEDPALHDTLNIMSEKPWEKLCEHFFATMGSLLYLSYIVGICVVIGGINPWLFFIVLVLMAPQVWLRSAAGKTYNSLYERQSGDERGLRTTTGC